MLREIIHMMEFEKKDDKEIFNILKEHKNRELFSIKKVINSKLGELSLEDIESYRDVLLSRLDEEIDQINFDDKFVKNTYEENEYKKFLTNYKNKLNQLFEQFLTVEV
ncbi:hypothetical protein [Metabacillus fastidiosus]|uniref:hypothetical protein n=1 Tax=Metabacillus fastidiosus TaxID=1458 RepID=UPI003D2A4DD2